jgi:predicted ATPase
MQHIKNIKASNILSFDSAGIDLELGSLNVLIGPNGSGKSNFMELFALLRSTPRTSEESSNNLQRVIVKGGGVKEWIWKGNSENIASIETTLPKLHAGQDFLKHKFSFKSELQRLVICDETIENKDTYQGQRDPYFYYKYQDGNPIVNINNQKRELRRESVDANFSILAQRRDPDTYPELLHISRVYENIRLYREWNFGRNTVFREPQKADLRSDRLEEDFSNLGLFLNQLGRNREVKIDFVAALSQLYEGLENYEVLIEGGTVQVFFTESNFNSLIPATRLSDGSLRYLCLLAILMDPTPPPLVCIEEPELGMHPDMLPKIADLLKSASKRTQLIVSTHSDILVDAMSDMPEAVLACEKHNGNTIINRLDPETLKPWLEKYRLGQLWNMGEIGANRW